MSSILETHELSKTFGGVTAVDNVSASFPDDSLYAILGPNGAGKTTFFNLLSGWLKPSNGDVVLNNQSISGFSPSKISRMGLKRSFQITKIFEGLTVSENIRVGVQSDFDHYDFWNTNTYNESVEKQINDTIDFVGLNHLRDRSAGNLSHGEQRMLEIALVVANEPQMLLLDEPSSGVSPEETKNIISLVQDLSKEFPIIMIEHKMSVVREVADYILVLHNGKKIADGPPGIVRNNEQVQDVYLGKHEI